MQHDDAVVADRLGVPLRVLALVVASGWSAVERRTEPLDRDPWRFRSVPSPHEMRSGDAELYSVRELRAGGYTDDDLRAVGLLPPRRGEDADWFVAGTPSQIMLGLRTGGPPLLARPDPGWHGPAVRRTDPVGMREVPGLVGCDDPEGEAASAVRAVRDRVLRSARRHVTWCRSCLSAAHRADTSDGLCHGCAQAWLGIVY